MKYVLGIGLSLFGFVWSVCAEAPEHAAAMLTPTQGNSVHGRVSFSREPNGISIKAEFSGLPPGKHGFHIHEYGDCSAPDASSAGEHFNPFGKKHGGPHAPDRHAGDFGNITAAEDGIAEATMSSEIISFEGPGSILGRSVVVHGGADDLTSQPAGAAGPRLGCGVIGVTK